MKASQLAALYAVSKPPQTVVIDTASDRLQKPPETLVESRSWREALQNIKDVYCAATPQEQAEIRDLLKRACD